jgi:hypothetical protein
MNKHMLTPKHLYFIAIALIMLAILGWNPGMNSEAATFTFSLTQTKTPTITPTRPPPTHQPCPRRNCTPIVTATPTVTPLPTITPTPTITWTPLPTNTPLPTLTPTAVGTPSEVIPVLLHPSNGATIAKTIFDWTDVVGATEYVIQFSDSDNFANILWQQSVTASVYPFTSSPSGLYYWRVYVSSPVISPYSDVWAVNLVNYDGDDDGDSLRNGWELHGYDPDNNGLIDIDLPALGANYRHKDIFVEMDYMVRASATNGLGPNQAVLDSIVQSFVEAPVPNPDGVDGVALHLETGNEVPLDTDLNPVFTEFAALKSVHFNPIRTSIYHYMIWADKYNGCCSSGFSFGIPHTDFIVTLGAWNGGAGGSDYDKIGTFIHEIGHNLALTHGGFDHINYKPNYVSVMNYAFQFLGVYREGSWYHFDYQRFDLPTLNETSLNETIGINGEPDFAGYGTARYCPNGAFQHIFPADGAIDWNCDGDATDVGVSVDVNHDFFNGSLISQDNWASIVFHGGGPIGSGQVEVSLLDESFTLEELTLEQYLEIKARFEEQFGLIEFGPSQ